MTNVKEANGHSNTQVGQNMTSEKIKIKNLHVTINVSSPSVFKFIKKLLKQIQSKKIIVNEKVIKHLVSLADNNSSNGPAPKHLENDSEQNKYISN